MILALSGGVGGARMLQGLQDVLGPQQLVAAVNTADDFDIYGMRVMPDIDSVLYTLAGLNDEERGWGRQGETWNFLETLRTLGEEGWFALGDRDLAVHVLRTHWLREGISFSEATRRLSERMRVGAAIWPMSDQPVATQLQCDGEWIPFQDYFVRFRCEPAVTGTRLAGSRDARPLAAWFDPLRNGEFDGVVICPSNPLLSIDPILQLPGVREALAAVEAPVIAVSPLIAGKSVKGPAAKLMRELGREASSAGIALFYAGLLDGILIDDADGHLVPQLEDQGLVVSTGDILMDGRPGRERVARLAMQLLHRCEHVR